VIATNPQLLAALLSFAPGLISSLFGSPQAKLRNQVKKLTSAQNVGATTNKFYQNAISSPAYSQAQGAIAAGANQAGNNVASSLAARGIGTSGTGAVLSGLTPSLVGSQTAGLRSSAYQGAQNQAQNSIEQQIAALTGTQGPSQSSQLFGVGLEAFLPYLQAMLARGGGGGVSGPTMGQPNFQYPLAR
jgi:hypothetical protein